MIKRYGSSDEMLRNVINFAIRGMMENKKNNIVIYAANRCRQINIMHQLNDLCNNVDLRFGHMQAKINRIIDIDVKGNTTIFANGELYTQRIDIIVDHMQLRGRNIDFINIDFDIIDSVDWNYIRSIVREYNENVAIY